MNETWQRNTQQYAIQINSASSSVPKIDGSLSYWGSNNEEIILSCIWYGLDDPDYSMMKYLPFLLTPLINGSTSPNTTTLIFERPGSLLSGVLPEGEPITLTSEKCPYKSEGSLIIDGNLVIRDNVTINMKEG